MASLLEQLRGYTTVVSDTGDFNAIHQFRPQDATTNPSLIAAASEKPEYASIVDDVLKQVRKDAGPSVSDKDVAARAFRPLEVAFGRRFSRSFPAASPLKSMPASPTTPISPSPRRATSSHSTRGRHRQRAHSHQAGVNMGRYQGSGDPREGRYPLQHDSPVRHPSGHRQLPRRK